MKLKIQQGVTLINVKSIENDSIIHEEFSGELIKLPLKVNSNKTKFLFDNKDTFRYFDNLPSINTSIS